MRFPVWFATNRNLVAKSTHSIWFGNDWVDSTTYGRAFVDIPSDLWQKLGAPGWFFGLQWSDRVEEHTTYRNALSVHEDEFWSKLGEQIRGEEPGRRSALLYLHGFGTTFQQAAQRSAALGFLLGIQTTAFYSWPSAGSVVPTNYLPDLKAAESSAPAIGEFIGELARVPDVEKLHVIAHSMGNHALFQALLRVLARAVESGEIRFGQVILAAPDVDARTMRNDIKLLISRSEGVTIYVSEKDKALELSRTAAQWPVAGLARPPFVIAGADTVEVSETDFHVLGHSYVATNVYVLDDMQQILWSGKRPPRKNMTLEIQGYWKLKQE